LTLSYGKKYEGEFKNGQISGEGTFSWPDMRSYKGEWENGKKNGYGTYTLPDGKKYVGEFLYGKLLNATVFSEGGKIIGEFVDGIYVKK